MLQGFVNGISFCNADHDIQGFNDLLFVILLTFQLFRILIMLIIPRFARGSYIFEVRDIHPKHTGG